MLGNLWSLYQIHTIRGFENKVLPEHYLSICSCIVRSSFIPVAESNSCNQDAESLKHFQSSLYRKILLAPALSHKELGDFVCSRLIFQREHAHFLLIHFYAHEKFYEFFQRPWSIAKAIVLHFHFWQTVMQIASHSFLFPHMCTWSWTYGCPLKDWYFWSPVLVVTVSVSEIWVEIMHEFLRLSPSSLSSSH